MVASLPGSGGKMERGHTWVEGGEQNEGRIRSKRERELQERLLLDPTPSRAMA